jgi:DNA recombination protein RmuC
MTIMYIPIESALIAAFETDQDLFDWALRSKIIITTPATLLALLRTCALQWTQHQMNENARNIGEQATVLLERLKTFTEHFEKMKKGLDSANNAFDAAVRSFNARLLPAANQTAQLMGNANLEREDIATISAVLPEKKTEQ